MLRVITISFSLLICISAATAQEVISGITVNNSVRSEWEKRDMKKNTLLTDTLELPFFDDFSSSAIYPDPRKWQDNYVFINNTYTSKQRSQGVATFDALDQGGRLYESATPAGFEADRLTSLPVNLKYTAADDIYLSFMYEPGGLSDRPESGDSLALHFLAPTENKWYSVWKTADITADTFRHVIIPVDKPRFLRKGFRFRFVNYASLSTSGGDPSMSANCDIWNIDYVKLGKNRNSADTLFRDVTFTKPVRSALKTYESMPWKQFRQVFLSEMGPWITVHYLNNDNITRNVTRYFEIYDVYKKSTAYEFNAGATVIPPGTPVTYNSNLLYTFSTDDGDSALFRIKSWLITDVFDPKPNDTILYRQHFGSYFSYDDGSAEAGYGINGLGSKNAMVAHRFKTFMPDSLRAIQICFNDSYQNSNQRVFDLMAWKNNSGVPGDVILAREEVMVKQGSGINGFHTYYFDEPVEITGEFFVGWKQRSETFLNAGLDLNTLPEGRQMYWINGDWKVSQAPGTVMIRPVFGPAKKVTAAEKTRIGSGSLRIWPNPASTHIEIETMDNLPPGKITIRVRDLNGREVIKTNYSGSLDISSLAPGVYFIVAELNNKPAGYARLLKTR